jgi:hypothetical protein
MMHRSVATHLVVLLIGMGAGLGAVAMAQDNPKASAAAADSRIVRELRTANSRLGAELILLNGTNRRLDTMSRNLDQVNANLSGFGTVAPPGESIRDVLRQVCVNTANSTVQQGFC